MTLDSVVRGVVETSTYVSSTYELSVVIFVFIWVVSFVPFYGGYFLIAYGTTRTLRFRDVVRLRFRSKLRWHPLATVGLWVHVFGRAMPYVYILAFGRNLPIWVYVLVTGTLVLSVTYIASRLLRAHGRGTTTVVSVEKTLAIEDPETVAYLWTIYHKNFEQLNKHSPCKQSYDKEEFVEALSNTTVTKYLLKDDEGTLCGIALVTTNLNNATWISNEYFETHYTEAYRSGRLYYFQGLAIDPRAQNRRLSIAFLEEIIDDLPRDALLAFDHSRNVNPLLHHFTKVVRQARTLRRKHIEQQLYHVVRRV